MLKTLQKSDYHCPCSFAMFCINLSPYVLLHMENFIRNSIRYRGAIAWNSLTNKETTAKTLKDFKRCLRKFDTDEMNFEPILAITKNRVTGYKYF